MEVLPQQVTHERPARSVVSVDDLDMAALRGAAPVVRKPFRPAAVGEAFDFTGSPRFPIEILIP